MSWDRRGGHARGTTGEHLTWSLAEGSRGTRWRESVSRDGVLVRSVLLEVSPAGSLARLEIATAAGLLTLHPEPDASAIHGNVVTPGGVRHLALAWSPSHELNVAGSLATDAVAIRRLTDAVAVGGRGEVDVVIIDDELDPRPGRWIVERSATDRSSFLLKDGRDAVRTVEVGPDGLPRLADPETWRLDS